MYSVMLSCIYTQLFGDLKTQKHYVLCLKQIFRQRVKQPSLRPIHVLDIRISFRIFQPI